MTQGILPIDYAAVPRSGGVTALAGMLPYLDLVQASGLRRSLERHAPAARAQGWSESQLSLALVLLNLAGGESVDDVAVLEGDAGLGELVRAAERHGLRGRARGAQERRERGRAFVPAPTAALRGLGG